MSDLMPSPTIETCTGTAAHARSIEIIPARDAELPGGLHLRRALPSKQRRLVGPWCFFDHYGPLAFSAGKAMDVPPHPHIGLQTVSWLLEGEVLHRDSLDSEHVTRPGELAIMTAGRAIAHSEETPPVHSARLHGVQLWIALPDSDRHTEPAFSVYTELPVVERDGSRVTILIGSLAGASAPARTYWPTLGAELVIAGGAWLTLALEASFEYALLVLDGEAEVCNERLTPGMLCDLGTNRETLEIAAVRATRAMLIGGQAFRERILMWWNLVARTPEEIAAAREDWERGRRFGEVRSYRGQRLAAPPLLSLRPVADH